MSRTREAVMNTGEPTLVLVPKPDRRESLLEQMSEAWARSPSLKLSLDEVQVRWSLDASTCHELLGLLVELNIIMQREDGTYSRAA